MIPNYVNGCVAGAQTKMYEWERSFAGTKELRVYDNSETPNPHPITSRITAIPIVTFDIILENIRPLLRVIEAVVFAALNLISAPFRLLIQGTGPAKSAVRCTFYNINQAVQAHSLAIVKITTSIIFLLVQLGMTLTRPQDAFPVRVGFNPIWLTEGHKMDSNDILDPLGFKENQVFNEPRKLFEPYIDIGQDYLFGIERDIARATPLIGRLVMIPLAAPLALIDTTIEVLRPIITTITWIAIVAVAGLVAAFDFITFQHQDLQGDLRVVFSYLHSGLESFAEAIGNSAMAPITFIAQTLNIVWDSRNATSSRIGLYGCQTNDRVLTMSGAVPILVFDFTRV